MKPASPRYFTMAGTARCAVPARAVAGGMGGRTSRALERVAPLHAARTSQRDVPTPFNTDNPFGIPIRNFLNSFGLKAAPLLAAFVLASCDKPSGASAIAGEDPQVKSLGTVEVTARLIEIPDGAIFQRDLYDYATILKYEVVSVHRGAVEKGATLYVGHYNPWKPRAEAADKRAKNIGGTLKQFRAGQLHRMALETPMDDHFMGGIVDKYFGKHSGPTYWAVWTDLAAKPTGR
jgi:hypothetical protein